MSSDTEKSEEQKKEGPKEENDDTDVKETVEVIDSSPSTSLNMTLFVYWVLPVLILSIVSRFGVSPRAPLPTPSPPRPISLDLGSQKDNKVKQRKQKDASPPSATPTAALSKTPTSYQQVVQEIQKRRPRWNAGLPSTKSASNAPTVTDKNKKEQMQPSDARTSSDPHRRRMDQAIEKIRKDYKVSNLPFL